MSPYRFAVLGDPVEHSRSPALHQAMLELTGLEGEYRKVRADSSVLSEAIQDLRAGRWNGLNITMPLKAEAARMADSLSPRASLSRSVNTLALRELAVHGETTDSTAFHQLLTDRQFGVSPPVLVLGGGGTAASAMVAMPDNRQVYLSARHTEQAEELAAHLGGEVVPWGAAVAGALVVNTTPLGMNREELPEGVLQAASGLIDLPYGSGPTPAVEQARKAGLPHSDGHEFLLRQAIASFALWTGAHVELDALRKGLKRTTWRADFTPRSL